MRVFNLDQIQNSIDIFKDLKALSLCQKSAFIDFSSGLYDVPLPMQFDFGKSNCHIKSGYKKGSSNFIIKIAGSGKFGNNGSILIFDAQTCELHTILEDKGFLTTLRTAITAIICPLPWVPENIGIIGSGDLAKQIFELAKIKYRNANVMIYARNKNKAGEIADCVCDSVEDLISKCDTVYTATSSSTPIISKLPIGKRIAIIGLGSDDKDKSEISPMLFKEADLVIVDSKAQAEKFGDVSKALGLNIISPNEITELGSVSESDLNVKKIIADFSGIGAQDVAMAEFVLKIL